MVLKSLILSCFFLLSVCGREALLLRYPSYHQGRVAFSHMGDVWVADDTGANLLRLTAHAGRDVYPRFSPDGKWVAFSSERNGNLDVFVVAARGGQPRQLTFHSGDDNVLGWTPDGRHVLFSSVRGEDFLAKLYTVVGHRLILPVLRFTNSKKQTRYANGGMQQPVKSMNCC